MTLKQRYNIIVWGYPPHSFVEVTTQTFHLIEKYARTPIDWYWYPEPTIESRRLIPHSEEEWRRVEVHEREAGEGFLVFLAESQNGLGVSISLDAGITVREFDVLVIDLKTEHLRGAGKLFGFDQLYGLFGDLIRLFHPFWAAIWDAEYRAPGELRVRLDETKIPLQIHWFNYFGEEIIENLGGKDKVMSAPVYLVKEWHEPPGIIMILQKEVFDYHNPHHRRKVQEVERYFDLANLQQRYLKR